MPEPRAQIGFQEHGIAGVLRQYQLQVPPNQREYAWTDKEVGRLFKDLTRAIADEESDEYFLGTLVTIPRSHDVLEVVDGQQRLATTAMFLAEIRNYLKDKEKLIAERINNLFLSEIDPDKRERVSKLTLNLDDNEYFRGMMCAENDSERPTPLQGSHELIRQTFIESRKQVARIVAGLDVKDHGDALNRWLKFLEHRVQVILVKAPTGANAYRMFETLNDRGLKTSQADLVKNYLFSQSGKRLNEAQQKWARMRSTLESLEEEDITVTFLRQAMIAIHGHLREEDVYEEVQKLAKGPQTSIQFLSSLESLAASYVAIFNPEHEKWNPYPDSMRRAIQTLNLLNIRTMRPLMLATAAQFPLKDASETFQFFISLGVRLLIASSTSRGNIEEPLANSAHSVFTGEVKDLAGLKKELDSITPSDVEFRTAFETATVSKAAFARYYLRSLEMAAKKEATPWFIPNDDKQAINLEHVLPERPEDNWPNFDEEKVRGYSKRIGNLALLLAKSNADLKSSDFATKRKVYRSTPYVLTSQIAGVDVWDEVQIVKRQKGLAEIALRAWPV